MRLTGVPYVSGQNAKRTETKKTRKGAGKERAAGERGAQPKTVECGNGLATSGKPDQKRPHRTGGSRRFWKAIRSTFGRRGNGVAALHSLAFHRVARTPFAPIPLSRFLTFGPFRVLSGKASAAPPYGFAPGPTRTRV